MIISLILHYHSAEFLKPFDISMPELCALYKTTHALAIFPLPSVQQHDETEDTEMLNDANDDDPTNSNDTDEPPGPHPDQLQAIANRDLARISFDSVTSTIINPHMNYFHREEEIEIDISLKKMLHTSDTEDAAAATKARLDLEESAPPELIKDLIRGQVDSDTKALKAQLGQLKRQISILNGDPVNTRRGLKKTGGASSPTKKVTKKQQTSKKDPKKSSKSPKPGNRRPNAPKAGAAANDSSSANKKKKQSKRRPKNTKRN